MLLPKNSLSYLYYLHEGLKAQVMETFKRELGEEHLYMLINIENQAVTFWYQGRWKEAEELFVFLPAPWNGVCRH